MSHSIQISDELWDAYDGSPSKMRDTLWQALIEPPAQPEQQIEFETSIVLQWDTKCNVCRKQLLAGETAMYRIPDQGGKQIICMDDARELAGIMDLNVA